VMDNSLHFTCFIGEFSFTTRYKIVVVIIDIMFQLSDDKFSGCYPAPPGNHMDIMMTV